MPPAVMPLAAMPLALARPRPLAPMLRRGVAPFALAAGLAAPAFAEAPRVAADIAPIHSLVARVMGEVGEPALVVPPGASPHHHAMRPSEAQSLQDADLVVWMGEDLTPALGRAIGTLAEGAEVLSLLEVEGIATFEYRDGPIFAAADADHDHAHDDHDHDHAEDAAAHDHDHDHDHDEGEQASVEQGHDHDDHDHAEAAHDHDHDHAEDHDLAAADAHDHAHDHAHEGLDPHAWLDPDNAALWLDAIAEALAGIDPDQADTYRRNAAAGREEMAALIEEIEGILEPARGQPYVVAHDAYRYFEERFDVPALASVSSGDAADPGPARLRRVRDAVGEEGVICVLTEPQIDAGLSGVVTEGADARLREVDPLGAAIEPGADLYPQLLRDLAEGLAACAAGEA